MLTNRRMWFGTQIVLCSSLIIYLHSLFVFALLSSQACSRWLTCTLRSPPPPAQSGRQIPGVCGSRVARAASTTAAGCGDRRWGSAGCEWLPPPAIQWCFPPCGTSLWWGDCCLLVVTAHQLQTVTECQRQWSAETTWKSKKNTQKTTHKGKEVFTQTETWTNDTNVSIQSHANMTFVKHDSFSINKAQLKRNVWPLSSLFF